MKHRLIDTLGRIGKLPHVEQLPDGTEVLVLSHGGRVLGLFAPGNEENFFWTNTALQNVDSAAAFFAGDQWHNSGGDRTWLAPEVDFFFPNFPKTDVYWQPRQLDPGQWQPTSDLDGKRWVNRLTCSLSRSKAQIELRMTKSIAPAPNPLRHEECWRELAGVQYAGYSLQTTLELLDAEIPASATVGLWNLLQLPHGGELLVPTYSKTEPRILFGTIPGNHLRSERPLVRYTMQAPGEQKIGIRAAAVAGRIGYRHPADHGLWDLVVRNVFVNPSGIYVDVPWNDLDDQAYAVQACNIHSGLGSFSELEHHTPAIGHGTGRTRCEDLAQTWAFRGSQTDIERIATALLSAPE